MNESSASRDRARAWVSAWITAMLSIAASIAIGFGGWLALGAGDTEPSESPLMLSVARQLDHGPWGLYGPFGRQNPLVLIHAPLYYHLAAILAWSLERSGLDPISAARIAGRALSLFGLLLTGWSACRIARLDGAPAPAGWWTACLIATLPVVGMIPFTVRPDMLGVALQTTGALLVLSALRSERPGAAAIAGGFAAFGAAMCIKQHLVGGFITATILLLWAALRGRVAPRVIGLGVLLAAAIVATVYGVEEVATEGRMSQAIFVAAPAAVRVHPADWMRGGIVLSTIIGGIPSLIVLVACAGLSLVASKNRFGKTVAVVGTSLASLALIMPIVRYFRASTMDLLIWMVASFGCVLLVIPCCVILERRVLLGGRLDFALCLFVAVELAIIVPLCSSSTGAWVNYAIPGVVFAAILTARSVSRACDEARLGKSPIPITVAALAVLSFEIREAYVTFHHLGAERQSAEIVADFLKEPRSTLYFAGAPGWNRTFGRIDLVFDDWLYPVFESVHLAQPRTSWLRSALTDGSVRFVITRSDDPRIDGLDEPLTSLGYVSRFEINSLFVWEQIRSPRRAGVPSSTPGATTPTAAHRPGQILGPAGKRGLEIPTRRSAGSGWLWRSSGRATNMNPVKYAERRSRLPRKRPHDPRISRKTARVFVAEERCLVRTEMHRPAHALTRVGTARG